MSELLKTEHLSIQFGGLRAVDDVNFCVGAGQTFGIIGPNGAGKTTLFNMCSGIYRPTRGRVYLNGEDITGLRQDAICGRGLARTFQTSQLFAYMSVLENVKVGCHMGTGTGVADAMLHTKRYRRDEAYAEEKSRQVIEKVGLTKYADTPAGGLSYGIQRRVEIARALATDPKILLLDEPAAGMNPNETASLMEFVQQLHAERQTVLLIEHDMKFVMNCCENILVLNFGQKICEGPPHVVRNDPGVQEAYFGSAMVARGGY